MSEVTTTFTPSLTVRKIVLFCNLLHQSVVGVMFDPVAEGVVIHASLRKPIGGDPAAAPVALVFDYAFDTLVTIPDIAVDAEGVRAVLSVHGMKQETFLPWHSIFAYLVGGTTQTACVIQIEDAPEHLRKSSPGTGIVQVDASGAPVWPLPMTTSKGGIA